VLAATIDVDWIIHGMDAAVARGGGARRRERYLAPQWCAVMAAAGVPGVGRLRTTMLTMHTPARPVRTSPLHLVKLVHTVVWAVFAAAILLIPVAAFLEAWRITVGLVALVLLECVVLAANRMRCPLTSVAARYTDDRRDNFDIYLPLWLATYNKHIFGTLFVLGLLFAAAMRLG
jgi:hypothetical protein